MLTTVLYFFPIFCASSVRCAQPVAGSLLHHFVGLGGSLSRPASGDVDSWPGSGMGRKGHVWQVTLVTQLEKLAGSAFDLSSDVVLIENITFGIFFRFVDWSTRRLWLQSALWYSVRISSHMSHVPSPQQKTSAFWIRRLILWRKISSAPRSCDHAYSDLLSQHPYRCDCKIIIRL